MLYFDNMMEFSERCLDLIKKIPKGKITTYKAIAEALNSRAYRAVGTAMKGNTNAPIVPCHRVVKADGFVGEYKGTKDNRKKIELLKSEGVVIKNNRIDLGEYLYCFK